MTIFLKLSFYNSIGDIMKKLLIIIILFIILLMTNTTTEDIEEETRAIFISYIELQEYIKKDDLNISKNNIKKMINNIKESKFNTIILQVRANSDSIYDSKIYPYSINISSEEGKKTYDVLDYFIEESHKNNIKLIAWINPYRVRTNTNIDSITINSPAYKYIHTDYLYINNGIYFNPSKKEIEDLIVKGVEEVLNYNIDGILFDDYFYPSLDIDINDYNEYIKNNNYISIEEYHLNIINSLIEKVHSKCKSKDIPFGISPDGNIENNYNKNMADVKKWMSSNKYIDFIMPQIYYGFYNSTKAYTKVIKEWEDLLKNKSIDFYVALAFYKVGIEDKYAKEGRDEWIINDNIIMREVLLSRNIKNYKGFSLFRYDNVFDTDHYTNNTITELKNLKKIIK